MGDSGAEVADGSLLVEYRRTKFSLWEIPRRGGATSLHALP